MGLGQALAQRPQLLPEGTIGLGNHPLVASAGRQRCGSDDIPAQGQGLLATQQRTAALCESDAAEAVETDLHQPAGGQLTESRSPLLLAQLLADPAGGQVLVSGAADLLVIPSQQYVPQMPHPIALSAAVDGGQGHAGCLAAVPADRRFQ